MANLEHEPDDVRRLLNLLYVIRVTEQVGEHLRSEDFVGGYHQALDDTMDAIQCEFAITDLDWIADTSAEGYPMDTEQQRPPGEERGESAEVHRLIAERNREDSEEYRNTMETMRQVAEEQRETREHLRQATRESDRQTAQVSLQPLLHRMDRFEDHLLQLGARLHGVEDLLKSMQALLQRFITEK